MQGLLLFLFIITIATVSYRLGYAHKEFKRGQQLDDMDKIIRYVETGKR